MREQLHQYEVIFALRKGMYDMGSGFGFNPPSVVHAVNLKQAWRITRKKCPKNCKIISVKRDWSDDYMLKHVPEGYDREGNYIGK